jgi:hypothetical protein
MAVTVPSQPGRPGGRAAEVAELLRLAVPDPAGASSAGFSAYGAPRKLRLGLDRRVSFEFVETPLREALSFLAELGGINIVLLPGERGRGARPVSLRVEAMPLEHALRWLATLSGVGAHVESGAVVFGGPGRSRLVLRVYDIRDFAPVRDFPGPDMVLDPNPKRLFGFARR